MNSCSVISKTIGSLFPMTILQGSRTMNISWTGLLGGIGHTGVDQAGYKCIQCVTGARREFGNHREPDPSQLVSTKETPTAPVPGDLC